MGHGIHSWRNTQNAYAGKRINWKHALMDIHYKERQKVGKAEEGVIQGTGIERKEEKERWETGRQTIRRS